MAVAVAAAPRSTRPRSAPGLPAGRLPHPRAYPGPHPAPYPDLIDAAAGTRLPPGV